MLFLDKILGFLERTGCRRNAENIAAAGNAAGTGGERGGRVVRKEREDGNAYNGKAEETLRAAGHASCADAGSRGEIGAAGYAWYFAVRDFFARSAGSACAVRREEGCFKPNVNDATRRVGGKQIPMRGEFTGADDSCVRIRGERSESVSQDDDEFFAGLASLRGLNVAERRKRGIR